MKKEFHHIIINGPVLNVNLEQVRHSILWSSMGRYGLIPFAKIQNVLEHWKDMHTETDVVSIGKFYWHDVILVPPQIANALLGEDKDNKCTYNSKGSTNGS